MIGKGVKDREKIEVKENIRYCKESKASISEEIKEINEQYNDNLIGREEHGNLLNRRFNGRTRLEWLCFCDRYVEEKERLIGEEKRNIEGLRGNIRFCKRSREKITNDVKELNDDYYKKGVNMDIFLRLMFGALIFLIVYIL